MKIALLITHCDTGRVGGAQIHVRDLGAALVSAGHQVTVLAGGDGPLAGQLRSLGMDYRALPHLVRRISPYHDARALEEIRAALSRLRPDLVAAHSSKAGWLGRLAARLLSLPCVFTAHGWAFSEGVPAGQRTAYALAERLAAPLAARIITVSRYDLNLALRYKIAAPEKLVTVYNGVPDLPPHLRGNPAGAVPQLMMVARFQPQKDHPTLLKALAGLRHLEWELALAGDGPLRPQMENLAASLGLAGRVQFLGVRQDIPELLARAQALVLISNWEGFPLSILEAMRAGLPVVASDVGGVKEQVTNGLNGFLVPRGGQAALQERLTTLITGPGLRARLGASGRKLFEDRFTVGQMVENTLSVYRDVLAMRS